MEKIDPIINSALWAAYGDALGFITELGDQTTVKWRTGKEYIENTSAWKRKIGGRFGVVVELPAGCYSDDTQLRLATSRAIRGDGKFDVEAFAKVEIPVWLSYALGGGRGSKAAAASLSKRDVSWTNNFFETKEVRYIDLGGNGAAMRIQPHVWAATNRSEITTFLPNVIRNAICTHGHARGILGAAFHALCLAYAIEKKTVPGPNELHSFADQLYRVSELIRIDNDLSIYWLPVWESSTRLRMDDAFGKVIDEIHHDIELFQQKSFGEPLAMYRAIVNELGCMSQQYRGSGTKTALLAAGLLWIYKDNLRDAIKTAANCLGSDTDTISTMAGAILGGCFDEEPPGKICDKDYINAEAERLKKIGGKNMTASFFYPDILKWHAPSAQTDFIGEVNGDLAVSGLGYARPAGESYEQKGSMITVWQWYRLSFGQSIFAKRRLYPIKIPITNMPINVTVSSKSNRIPHNSTKPLFDTFSEDELSKVVDHRQRLSIDQATQRVIASNFNPEMIGEFLLDFAERENGIELTLGFSAIIAKARQVRIRKTKG